MTKIDRVECSSRVPCLSRDLERFSSLVEEHHEYVNEEMNLTSAVRTELQELKDSLVLTELKANPCCNITQSGLIGGFHF